MSSKNYDSLYLEILKIGIEKVNDGLSFNQLKNKLEKKGYDFENDCIELAVKQWFVDNFIHYEIIDEKIGGDIKETILEMVDNIGKLENGHLDCNFILKGTACLALLQHKNARNSLHYTFGAFAVALIALIISILVAIL
ncbi:hypothetical protein EZS27_018636 [termite gut metagenome]|uniref:Uncharacterized protein n=1 Tax=termite gut metagenome TaxID=433724 RepID=A0A5J4RHU1_9ZZZZ